VAKIRAQVQVVPATPAPGFRIEVHAGGATWGRYDMAMPGDTATIRVRCRTRDLLARQARARGQSLASLLEEIASERELDMVFESERRATRVDARDPRALEELRLWESTLEDGLESE